VFEKVLLDKARNFKFLFRVYQAHGKQKTSLESAEQANDVLSSLLRNVIFKHLAEQCCSLSVTSTASIYALGVLHKTTSTHKRDRSMLADFLTTYVVPQTATAAPTRTGG